MIKIHLDQMMAREKIGVNELAERVGLTPANLSILKTGKGKAVRFTTLSALCDALHCQPGDILKYEKSPDDPTVLTASQRTTRAKFKEITGIDLNRPFNIDELENMDES